MRRLWFKDKDRAEGSKASYSAEVLLAGSIPPPQPPAIAPEAAPEKEAAEASAFLSRVYTNQGC